VSIGINNKTAINPGPKDQAKRGARDDSGALVVDNELDSVLSPKCNFLFMRTFSEYS